MNDSVAKFQETQHAILAPMCPAVVANIADIEFWWFGDVGVEVGGTGGTYAWGPGRGSTYPDLEIGLDHPITSAIGTH